MEILPALDLSWLTVADGRNEVPKLHQAGVEINVRPQLVLRGTSRQGRAVVGVVKLNFPKRIRSAGKRANMSEGYFMNTASCT